MLEKLDCTPLETAVWAGVYYENEPLERVAADEGVTLDEAHRALASLRAKARHFGIALEPDLPESDEFTGVNWRRLSGHTIWKKW